jgi:hypothetical protein
MKQLCVKRLCMRKPCVRKLLETIQRLEAALLLKQPGLAESFLHKSAELRF